ncbi:MAG: class I SAM-dependent methyltransferase [Rubrobacter sp.]
METNRKNERENWRVKVLVGEDRLDIRRRMLFARSMIANPRQVGAVWPTSRRAVCDLLDMSDLSRAEVALEFGVGTGVYTAQILRRLSPEARLLALEVDGAIAELTAQRLPDRRLTVIKDSAERAGEYLGGEHADAVVSSLPFTTLPHPVGRDILDLVPRILAPDGAFLVLQYSRGIEADLEERFASVERILSPLNVPPAFLYRCMAPIRPGKS